MSPLATPGYNDEEYNRLKYTRILLAQITLISLSFTV
jgi:hypothetical protein